MEKIPEDLEEVIFGSSDKTQSLKIASLLSAGKIKKLAPRLYTGKIKESPETIIRRNIFTILGRQFGGAVLSHRSALEFKPTASGSLFLTYSYTKKIELPGITLRIQKGPGPLQGDNKFVGELYVSSPARAYLENMQVSRKTGPDSKILPREQIEERLEKMIRMNGEEALNELRDRAKEVVAELSLETELDKLNIIISSLLGTHSPKSVVSPAARARAYGIPYDADRLHLLEQVFAELQQRVFKSRPDKNTTAASFSTFAFYESYFSNYIEGTVFKVEEAQEIIASQQPMPTRDEDSHDMLGTYSIVANRREMAVVPKSGEHLLDILLYRHKVLLSARETKNPGVFKDKDNYAGNTKFVAHALVRGTLVKGYDYYAILASPFARAVFMMFLISEVHPFLDGNGRLARVMMNAELVAASESKIIIPTVFRDDYIGALRRLSRRSEPDAYIRMMEKAHAFSENVYGENSEEMEDYLESCNAFTEDTEGKLLKIVPRA